ncbi:MAG: hypothetical protein R6W81_05560 [Bacteroidales bacterium]
MLLLSVYTCPYLMAQERGVPARSREDSLAILKKELNLMQNRFEKISLRLDSLVFTLRTEEKITQEKDDLQRLIEEAGQLAEREKEQEDNISRKFQSGVRQQQGLNPNISLSGDFFGAVSSSKNDYISESGDFMYGNNGFFLREVEIALEAPLDPFTRGKTYLSVSQGAISIEEAYMEWLNLPLNMNLKIGIFYSEFGPINRYHDHALPQFDRPRALVNLFSNKGLGGTGISSNFMLPRLLFSDASTLDLSVINGGNDISFSGDRQSGMLFTGQFKNYYDITQNSYFEVRLSGATGRNPSPGHNNSYIGSLGLTYKWVPAGREKYRTLDWKTEFLMSFREEYTGTIRSKGFYSTVQNKLNARFWLGARIGYSEMPYDKSQYEWDYTINLDFWQSEFIFTRFQYQYNRRSINSDPDGTGLLPNDHTFVLQVCWAMGPHKHEAY